MKKARTGRTGRTRPNNTTPAKTIGIIRRRITKLADALDAALLIVPDDAPWSVALNLEIINQTAIRIVGTLALPESVSP